MKRLPNGILLNLHERSGIPVTRLSDYVATRGRPSRERSLKLEQITGISASIWLFGESEQIKQALMEHLGNQ